VNTATTTEPVPQKIQGGFIQEVFGQLITRGFWKALILSMAQQAFAAFMMAFAGKIYWYGTKLKGKTDESPLSGFSGSNMSEKAFGDHSIHPTTSFQHSTAFPVPVKGPRDSRFPGF